ncbi:MAG: hypothetical protein ABSF95_00485 [Verrucomicrobiota bacterium]|jgi:hypothetical protein
MKTGRNTASILKPVLFLIVGLVMVGAAWWLTKLNRERQKIKRQRQEFLASQGVELLGVEEKRNREAMDLAQQQLAAHFSRYHSGVPKFAEDLTTWGTRYEISKALLKDWWSKSNEARKVATDHFAKFVVSDQQLQEDVTAVLAQFSSDLEANRNKLLSELQEKVSTSSVPCASTELGSTNIAGAFMVEVQPLLRKQAVQSPVIEVLATAGGLGAGGAATKIVSKLLTSMAARVATGAAARGSSVAAGAVAGGEGGTLVTPGVGTAIGIVGGIVVGWAVDWWMESRFKEKVTNECNQILNDMEKSLWNDPNQGLASSFGQAVKITHKCHETALRKIITGDEN